jgi:predicted DNA-binding ribbon-helix-helix protein
MSPNARSSSEDIKTSARLGDVSWQSTKEMTWAEESALSSLVGKRNQARRTDNPCSILRVFVLEYYRMRSIPRLNAREPNRSKAFYSPKWAPA